MNWRFVRCSVSRWRAEKAAKPKVAERWEMGMRANGGRKGGAKSVFPSSVSALANGLVGDANGPARTCQIRILSHAETMTPSDAFVDDSMDRKDSLAASPRFTVQRTPEGIRVQLQEGDGGPGTALTIERALALLENLLEQGRAVTIHD